MQHEEDGVTRFIESAADALRPQPMVPDSKAAEDIFGPQEPVVTGVKPRRVVFQFDERSLTDLDTLIAQGRLTARDVELMKRVAERREMVRDIGDEPATITNLDTRDALEQREFAPGDVVQLTSGGPLMTVVEVKPDIKVASCDMNNVVRFNTLPPAALRLADK